MKKQKSKRIGNIVIAVLAVLLVSFVCVRSFWIDWYTVSGDSMHPTYHDGQIVFGNKTKQPQRFDVVIVQADDLVGEDLVIKRVVAFEGEKVWSENGVLFVESNGQVQSFDTEDYGGGMLEKIPAEITKTTVSQGCVYLLGDNRDTSIDSRALGEVSVDRIEAVVF